MEVKSKKVKVVKNCLIKVACNVYGLAFGVGIYILQPERQPNKELKDEDNYKSWTKYFQPGTKDAQRTKDEEKHVSPTDAKPHVSCRLGLVILYGVEAFPLAEFYRNKS